MCHREPSARVRAFLREEGERSFGCRQQGGHFVNVVGKSRFSLRCSPSSRASSRCAITSSRPSGDRHPSDADASVRVGDLNLVRKRRGPSERGLGACDIRGRKEARGLGGAPRRHPRRVADGARHRGRGAAPVELGFWDTVRRRRRRPRDGEERGLPRTAGLGQDLAPAARSARQGRGGIGGSPSARS
jgi:hypothetical protein